MKEDAPVNSFHFPKWTNLLRPGIAIAVIGGALYVLVLAAYGGSPRTTDVGYAPIQPVPYSHALHNGQLGIDCRYCHNTVEQASHAAVPPTETCMVCHQRIYQDSPKLSPVFDSWGEGTPVEWVRIHDLPDYAYFNHSAHVRRGIGCVSCHGRMDQAVIVAQVETLSMGWCLSCHRNAEQYLQPKDTVTQIDWEPGEDQDLVGARLREEYNINPPTECYTCHR
jgi:hypothetical protein